MIRKLRIAVDHGNKNMKTCNQVFTTALITQDKKPARGEEYIFYEGKYYLLSNRRIPYQRDKTEDERFFILCVQRSWTTLAGASPVTVIASEPCS